MTTETKPWPIDFDALAIGDRVPVEAIEQFCGLPRTSRNYRLKGQVALLDLIRKRRPDLDTYVRCLGDDLVVMSDAEAARWRERGSRNALHSFLREHRRNLGVRSAELGEDERSRHERVLYANGRHASAIGTVRKELRLEAYRSQKPALKGGSE